MGRSFGQWLRELGPGGASTFTLAFLSATLGLGIPVALRLRAVLDAASRDETGPADAVLVLGRSLSGDLPTEVFRARLERKFRVSRWLKRTALRAGVSEMRVEQIKRLGLVRALMVLRNRVALARARRP